jgi:hypothetical protein
MSRLWNSAYLLFVDYIYAQKFIDSTRALEYTGDVIRHQQGHELWCRSSRKKPSMLLLLQQNYFPACEHSSMHVRHANVEAAHLREKRQHHQQWYEIIEVCAMFSFFVRCTSSMLYEHLKVRSSIIQVGPVGDISFWSGLIFSSDFVVINVWRSVCRSQGQTATLDFALCVCNLHSKSPSPFHSSIVMTGFANWRETD